MAFDPYTNVEVMELLKQQENTEKLSPEMLKSYYKLPVMCLLRIKDSIDTWEKRSGADGYFDFIELLQSVFDFWIKQYKRNCSKIAEEGQ